MNNMDSKVVVGKRIWVHKLSGKTPSKKARQRGEHRTYLSHYTNVEALLAILKGKQFKANRIDFVDDLKEKTYLQELIDNNEALPYVVSFDHRKPADENVPLWNMYTAKETGIMLTLYVKDSTTSFLSYLLDNQREVLAFSKAQKEPMLFSHYPQCNNKLQYSNIGVHTKILDVVYDEKENQDNSPLPVTDLKDWDTYGAVKAKAWKFQTETRIIADFELIDRPDAHYDGEIIPKFEYLMLPIRFDLLSKIGIIFSPWMGDQTKTMIKEYVGKLDIGCKITFKDSKYTGIITKK